jgi:hypothetical protein
MLATVLVTSTAASATATTAAARSPREERVISCRQVDDERLPSVFARECDTTHWGPLSDFVIRRSGSRHAFFCRRGWAEGSLWVNGQDCRRLLGVDA